MRKALVIGIDSYEFAPQLFGCVNDAYAMKSVLDRNSDGTVNFAVKLLTATSLVDQVKRAEMRSNIEDLFEGESEIALFYFSGHGYIDISGGYLVASDTETGDDGIPVSIILDLANYSSARNRIIILDSCFSGIAASKSNSPSISELKEGTTILTASTEKQYASEENNSGVFTTLFVDAMNGAGANLLGDVSPGSIYAHIDQSLGPWEQRPVFKTNVKTFVSMRKVQPPISLQNLQRIIEFFPAPGFEFRLDPTFEPERSMDQSSLPKPDPHNTAIFAILQEYNRINLVIPVDAPHMWHAAINSKSCKLTVLGEHYRRLVEKGLI